MHSLGAEPVWACRARSDGTRETELRGERVTALRKSRASTVPNAVTFPVYAARWRIFGYSKRSGGGVCRMKGGDAIAEAV
jgi:hypothetical protein